MAGTNTFREVSVTRVRERGEWMFTIKIMSVWKLRLLNQYVVISCSHKTGVGQHFKFSNIPYN